ncbi:cilia- and flagella-associated protein 337-like isoform X3 [Babylonia areolata]|uniref:cilia- and flagella-associated protein 337-like isoform X3 n=1 Tax=Babylonia areolata TaxID=304850 RepID=UPI003FD3D9B7
MWSEQAREKSETPTWWREDSDVTSVIVTEDGTPWPPSCPDEEGVSVEVLNVLDLLKKYYDFSNKTFPKLLTSPAPEDSSVSFDKENNPAVRLEEKIKLQHLQELQNEFERHKPEDIRVPQGDCLPDKIEKRTPGCMNLQEFQDAVAKVLGTHDYDEYLEKLFTKLDTSCDGYVDWEEFLTYMMLLYRENDYLRTKKDTPFQVEAVIRHIVHNRQEPSTKIVAVDAPTRYVTISKEGAMSVWQPSMALEKTYTIPSDESDSSPQKRRFKMWVTDAVYMRNCEKIAVGSTGRDIRFYDVSTNQYFEEFHLCSMSDVPYCFDYWYNEKAPNNESLLMFGDDTGAIHLMYFLKPVTQLFETPFKSEGGVQKIYMQELPVKHNKLVRHVLLADIHPDIIRQVRYLPDNDAIISSSASPKCSIVISDTSSLKKAYVFKIDKGVESFDHSKNLSLLVTGSADHHVRLWNPYVPNKPVAVLTGHATGVIGVAIHEGFLQVFSYSKDAVIKVWDVKEHLLLQTVILQFPSSLHARMPEHGQFPLHLQPSPHDALLVSCNDYIGMLKLGRPEPPSSNAMPVTHDTQLCCAIYNTFFKQVVTGCDSSSIAVWDIETGNKSIVFSNAHGDEEITCMVFDETMRRLISGARNGTIKVWNFQNGHNLHKLEPATGEAEVTGILPVLDKKVILAVGWSRLITYYDDSDADNMYVTANYNWKGGQLHDDDILTCDHCPPHYVATAGFDGEIIVWDLETEKVFARLRKGQRTNIRKQVEELQRLPSSEGSRSTPPQHGARPASRPNSRHRTSHKVPFGHPVPVDKLLFLRGRASVKHTEKAMLLSSEAGHIKWWNIYATKPEMGYFYAPDAADESVLAMCSKPNNSLLVTGDTQGVIKVWSIVDYCVTPQDRRVKTAPPLEAWWKAHDAPVVSVEYVQHEAGDFILSASTDKTARLWTPEGHYVGTFGQNRPWTLKNPKTWAHPKTPWSTEDMRSSLKAGGVTNGTAVTDNNNNNNNNNSSSRSNAISNNNNNNNDDNDKLTHPELVIGDASEKGDEEEGELGGGGTDTESVASASSSIGRKKTKGRPKSVAVVEEPAQGSSPLPRSDLRLKYRSQTFAFDFDRSKTFLGLKVERELERKQRDRQGRRQTYGEIEVKRTARFGKLCSPFHALTTPVFEDIRLPERLPLSQRMINKGYSSDTLTVETIRTMDFSYGGPDTPPSSQQLPSTSTLAPSPMLPTSTSKRLSTVRALGESGKLPPIRSGRNARTSLGMNAAATAASKRLPTVIKVTDADDR